MIGTFTIFAVFVVLKWFVCRHFRKLKGSHQSVYPADTDVNAIIKLENVGDLIWAEPFVVVGVDVKDL